MSTSLLDFSFTREDIISALKELDPYSACPNDDVPARILTSSRDELSSPLHILWSDSLTSGFIPPVLKSQFITPVYKKDDRTYPANYRPVSLPSQFSHHQDLRTNNERKASQPSRRCKFDKQQPAWVQEKRSCLTQLLSHIEFIYKCLNGNNEVDVIYLDYSKAFD